MALTIAIIAAGAMGSAVAQRLVEHGVMVRTSLEGRSPASA
jgi:3-hydroxyisobutyrate dehydrogenase-like beta-hydroxyacid dehydrogenase